MLKHVDITMLLTILLVDTIEWEYSKGYKVSHSVKKSVIRGLCARIYYPIRNGLEHGGLPQVSRRGKILSL